MAFDGKQIRNATLNGATKLIDLSISTDKLADNAISSAKIADDSITTSKILNLNVTTGKLADSAVTALKLATDSVTTVKIVDSNVTTAKIADSAVTDAKISAVAASKITGQISNSQIADSAVTSAKIADGTIVGTDIASNTVAASNLVTTYEAGLLYKDGSRAMTGSLDLGTTNKIVNLANPTSAQDAATKSYVDSAVSGLDLKASVHVATSSNVVLSGGAPNTVDGHLLSTNERVLVKSQTDGTQNGIYVVTTLGTGSNGTWTRATDADTSAEVMSGMFTFVEQGTTYGSTGWVLVTPDPITLGTTSLTFTQFSGAGTYLAGFGLSLTGNTFAVIYGTSATDVGATGSAGSANTSSRADHQHAHGALPLNTGVEYHATVVADSVTAGDPNDDGYPGFMDPADAAKVFNLPFNHGGQLNATLDANDHLIINLNPPTTGKGAANKNYVDTFTANRSAGGFRLTNLATPSAGTDAVNRDYVDSATVGSSTPQSTNKAMVALVTTGDAQKATNTGLAAQPKGYVQVFVNGIRIDVAGTTTGGEAFFGPDASTARTLGSAQSGDFLWWNGSIAGYELAVTDRLDFDFVT